MYLPEDPLASGRHRRKAVAGLKADYKPHLEPDIQAVRDFLKELDAHQRAVEAKRSPRKAMDKRTYDDI